MGGGLIRSLGGWSAVKFLRGRKERVLADERVLGSSALNNGNLYFFIFFEVTVSGIYKLAFSMYLDHSSQY